jgi:hypothetical protein
MSKSVPVSVPEIQKAKPTLALANCLICLLHPNYTFTYENNDENYEIAKEEFRLTI